MTAAKQKELPENVIPLPNTNTLSETPAPSKGLDYTEEELQELSESKSDTRFYVFTDHQGKLRGSTQRVAGVWKEERVSPKQQVLYNLIELTSKTTLPVLVVASPQDAETLRVKLDSRFVVTCPYKWTTWEPQYNDQLKDRDVYFLIYQHGKYAEKTTAFQERAAAELLKTNKAKYVRKTFLYSDKIIKVSHSDLLDRAQLLELNDLPSPQKTDIVKLPLTQRGLGERLVRYSKGRIIYSENFGCWYSFTGKRWLPSNMTVESHLKKIIDEYFELEADLYLSEEEKKAFDKFRSSCGQYPYMKNSIASAASEDGVLHTEDEFDKKSKGKFNFQNGTLDLKTGELKPHNPADLLTQIVDCDYEKDAECPEMDKFMESVFKDNPDVVPYIWAILGYLMTGETCLPSFVVFYGEGANGKGTLWTTIMKCFGTVDKGYSGKLAPQHLQEVGQKVSDLTPHWARLKRARLIVASEAKESIRIDSQAIKERLGGSETQVYRDVYQRTQEQNPFNAIILLTNHPIEVDDQTKGFERRFYQIPCNQIFENQNDDTTLPDRLMKERAGILAKMAKYAKLFYDNNMANLALPECVKQSIDEALRNADPVNGWLESGLESGILVKGSNETAQLSKLRQSFDDWRKRESNSSSFSTQKFRKNLEKKGYKVSDKRTNNKTFIEGLGIIIPLPPSPKERKGRDEDLPSWLINE